MFEVIKERFKEYIDTKLQLYQLTVEEKMINFASNFLYLFLLAGAGFLSLIFILILLAKLLNTVFNNDLAGYGFVASLCLFLLYMLSRPERKLRITTRIRLFLLINIKK